MRKRWSWAVAALLALGALLSPAAAASEPRSGVLTPQIVGGGDAGDGEWPFVVSLNAVDVFDGGDDVLGHFCGGTLIQPSWVLTAAHCLTEFDPDTGQYAPVPPAAVEVIAGRTVLSSDAGTKHAAAAFHLHPGWLPNGPPGTDIGLVRLATPSTQPLIGIPAADNPVAFPPQQVTFDGTVGVVGWGNTSPVPDQVVRADRLQELAVPLWDDDACVRTMSAVGLAIDLATELCAGGEDGQDSCHGDSGGPLLRLDQLGNWWQIGVVSRGLPRCALAGVPAIYTWPTAFMEWMGAVIAADPDPPDPGPPDPVEPEPPDPPQPPRPEPDVQRVSDPIGVTEPVGQAVATSQAAFQPGSALHAVLARSDDYPDALAGSALGFGVGPVLFTGSTGPLAEATRAELQRVLAPGGTVYLLGGGVALPLDLEDELVALGYQPRRLAGRTREETAVEVAAEVRRRLPELGATNPRVAILATRQNWPDAVAAGSLASIFGVPILLTPSTQLHEATEQMLAVLAPEVLYVIGGRVAVDEATAARAAAAAGVPPEWAIRLGGAERTGTAVTVSREVGVLLAEGGQRPAYALAVNLRRADGYAHLLSASAISGRFLGVFVPVEGEAGTVLTPPAVDYARGLGTAGLLIGGPDVVSDEVGEQLRELLLP